MSAARVTVEFEDRTSGQTRRGPVTVYDYACLPPKIPAQRAAEIALHIVDGWGDVRDPRVTEVRVGRDVTTFDPPMRRGPAPIAGESNA